MRVAQLPDATSVCHTVSSSTESFSWMNIARLFYFWVSPSQRGTEDAEMTVSSAQSSELSKTVSVKSGASCNN